jgi:hypothetical protein
MKATHFLIYPLIGLLLSGCTASSGVSGNLGYSQDRRVVIIGEKVSREIAVYYQRRYDAMVWFTPTQGVVKDSAQVILKGLGPSEAMRALINELKSIDYSVGRWEIIVPKIGEGYFLETLKDMDTDSLGHARGNIVLIDSKGNKEMEAQVARVTSNNFFVTYEFQKY